MRRPSLRKGGTLYFGWDDLLPLAGETKMSSQSALTLKIGKFQAYFDSGRGLERPSRRVTRISR